MSKRTHVVIPEQLVKDIDMLVGARQRSILLTQAAEEKLMRYRQLKATLLRTNTPVSPCSTMRERPLSSSRSL